MEVRSVRLLSEDGDDTVSAVLAVAHGTLNVGSLAEIGRASCRERAEMLAGSAASDNTVLAELTYTATAEFEGSDTVNVTVTSKDGSNTSATQGTASTAITINPVAEAGTAAVLASLTQNEYDINR